MNKRIFKRCLCGVLTAAMAATALVGFTGCAGGADLTVMIYAQSHELDIYEEMRERFEEENPDVGTVDIQQVQQTEYATQVTASLAAGSMADVFYEWNPEKEKAEFFRKDGSLLYMAGFYELFQEVPRFIILTTQANPSVRPVHHRMPLILEKEELEEWIWENCSMEKFLKKTPGLLECRQEYRQERLFFL